MFLSWNLLVPKPLEEESSANILLAPLDLGIQTAYTI